MTINPTYLAQRTRSCMPVPLEIPFPEASDELFEIAATSMAGIHC
jgi:hypothetical protein